MDEGRAITGIARIRANWSRENTGLQYQATRSAHKWWPISWHPFRFSGTSRTWRQRGCQENCDIMSRVGRGLDAPRQARGLARALGPRGTHAALPHALLRHCSRRLARRRARPGLGSMGRPARGRTSAVHPGMVPRGGVTGRARAGGRAGLLHALQLGHGLCYQSIANLIPHLSRIILESLVIYIRRYL